MDFGLTGKVALVTGAGRGIGRASAIELAREGADVAITFHRAQNEADDTVQVLKSFGRRAIAIRADASNPTQVKSSVAAVLEQLGRIDVLVNNAGNLPPAAHTLITKMSIEHWDQVIATYMTSSFTYTKYAAQDMMERGWGRIVNIASCIGERAARPGLSHYTAAKAGIIGLTLQGARELGPFGITVNSISPGYIVTADVAESTTDELRQIIDSQTPVGRLGTSEEIGTAVAFLASTQASYINGSNLDINGGRIEFAFPNIAEPGR